MACDIEIDLTSAEEFKITCMQGDAISPGIKFWLDEAKTDPRPLAGIVFLLQIRDKAGDLIKEFTMTDGLTIENVNELWIESVMSVDPGTYRYDLVEVEDDLPITVIRGDFVVKKRETIIS